MTFSPFEVPAFALFILAALGHGMLHRRSVGRALTACAGVACLGVVGTAWHQLGRPPFKTLRESLVLFCACGALLQLLLRRRHALPLVDAGLSAGLAGAMAWVIGHPEVPLLHLPPTLQSPWFVPHVVVYFLAYAALSMAAVAAVAVLLLGTAGAAYVPVMHRSLVAGYILLSAGLVVGAIWASQAWGSYWAWDAKENWALISWFTYTLYFHVRRLPGRTVRTDAWLALTGFAVVMFTYLGMRLLPVADASVHNCQ